MAVSKVGTTYSDTASNANTRTISNITVHADCEASIVVGHGGSDPTKVNFDVLNWDSGSDVEAGWTQIINQGAAGTLSMDSYWMAESHANHPAAGSTSQTLTYALDDNNVTNWEDGHCCLFFVSGVDTSDFIIGTDGDHSSSASSGFTSSSLGTVTADDMAIIAACQYYSNISSGSGQTNIVNFSGSAQRFRVDYELGEDTPSMTWPNSSYWAGIAFAISAESAGTTYTLTADAGSFSLTGTAADLEYNRHLDADAGIFSLAGQQASLLRGVSISAEPGAFALTGQDAGFEYNRNVTAAPGAFVFSGQATSLLYARIVTAEPGSFSITGAAATLVKSIRMAADGASFTLTGIDADLEYHKNLLAESGVFVFSGQDAGLSYSSGTTLLAETGVFALTGQDASLRCDRALDAEAASFIFTGADAALVFGYVLSAGAGNYVLSGADAALARALKIIAQTGSFVLTGADATLTYSGSTVPVGVVTVSISAAKPGVTLSAAKPGVTIS